mmetsp:Transcript_38387/g.84367  ORF Transcript_38387/g.84367 Transcript_38387/m.84367 type:complete len:232 (-) Transcript_38387:1773-2468(-)
MSRFAGVSIIRQSATRAFSPPERVESKSSAFSPLNMNLPSSARSSSYLKSVDRDASSSVWSTVLSSGKALAWSCSKYCITALDATISARPWRGFSFPISNRSSVDLPAPLGPRMATRSPRSRTRSMSEKSVESPYPCETSSSSMTSCEQRGAGGKRKLNLRLGTNGLGTCSLPPSCISLSCRSFARIEAAADSIFLSLEMSLLSARISFCCFSHASVASATRCSFCLRKAR